MKIKFVGVDGFDRACFLEMEGERRILCCVFPLWNGSHRPLLEMYTVNLYTVTPDGEPDQPAHGEYELVPYEFEWHVQWDARSFFTGIPNKKEM